MDCIIQDYNKTLEVSISTMHIGDIAMISQGRLHGTIIQRLRTTYIELNGQQVWPRKIFTGYKVRKLQTGDLIII